jgi:phosphoglycolate phosphatase-like HAD superfamily hydrolase
VRSLHIVWDWNGTLLDDLDIVIESLNVGTVRFGVGPIDPEGYRDHFTRPVRGFYESLFARPISDMEWAQLNKSFHDEYYARVKRATLSVGARETIDRVAALGWSQSLLSMSIHDHLLEIVSSHGIADRFTSVDGIRSPTGGLKARHLEIHLASQQMDPSTVLLVGDTPDDAVAAREVGAGIVLYDGGSHHLEALRALDAPVAHSLAEAIDHAIRLARGETLGVSV